MVGSTGGGAALAREKSVAHVLRNVHMCVLRSFIWCVRVAKIRSAINADTGCPCGFVVKTTIARVALACCCAAKCATRRKQHLSSERS